MLQLREDKKMASIATYRLRFLVFMSARESSAVPIPGDDEGGVSDTNSQDQPVQTRFKLVDSVEVAAVQTAITAKVPALLSQGGVTGRWKKRLKCSLSSLRWSRASACATSSL